MVKCPVSERTLILQKLTWLVVWPGVEAAAALDAFEAWIGKQRTRPEKNSLAIRLLNTMFEQAPKMFGELHDVALDRLGDIGHHARYGLFSNRTVWCQDGSERADEKIVQVGIVEQMQARVNSGGSLERESEPGSSVKPDISIER